VSSSLQPARAVDPLLDPGLDAQRRRALRRMRTIAVGLLVLAAVVYLLTLDRTGFVGFVNAGAEASMVGAIADWFAVTALFRHPLGLPVPHTALIPRRKDDLGRSLEQFVGENFLQEDVVRERLEAVELSRRVGAWIAVEANARRAADEVASVLGLALARVADADAVAMIEAAVLPRLIAEPVSPVAGSLLQEIVRDGAHHGLVDLALDEALRWLGQNEDTFADVLAERAPWWSPAALNDRVTHRIHLELMAWIQDIRSDPYHHARAALDQALARLAEDLLSDGPTQERMERLKERVLSHPQLLATATSLWQAFRRALIGALDDAEGPLRRRAVEELTGFGRRLQDDDALRARLDGWAADVVVFAIERYGRELTTVITATVNRWDGREAARRIELHVGRDLQFIRVNGTIVGGLVGLVIHAVSLLL
jgi:uncharacterized membrane-anchored protein YjiN (DUF445 family)